MANPVDITKQKLEQITLLWNQGKLQDVLAFYASDASLTNDGVTYKGHDELLKAFEKYAGTSAEESIFVDSSLPSEDYFVEKLIYKANGKEYNATLAWKKVDNDWKIVSEEWV